MVEFGRILLEFKASGGIDIGLTPTVGDRLEGNRIMMPFGLYRDCRCDCALSNRN
jgi:hypothetical protein